MLKHTWLLKPLNEGFQVFCFSKQDKNYIREMFFRKDPTNSFWLVSYVGEEQTVTADQGNDIYKMMTACGYQRKHPQDIEQLPTMNLEYWRSTHQFHKAKHPEYF